MIICSNGLVLTGNEYACILHVEANPEAWLTSIIEENVRVSRDSLIKDWRPILHADASVTELPANEDALITLILARSDFRTRIQKDEAQTPAEPINTLSKDNYDSVTRDGSNTTLFASGITLTDLSGNLLLAYMQNIEEFVYGALMGHVNRGKKKMIAQYHPIIMTDASVTTMPATEDGLITMIRARADYKSLA